VLYGVKHLLNLKQKDVKEYLDFAIAIKLLAIYTNNQLAQMPRKCAKHRKAIGYVSLLREEARRLTNFINVN
jgi:hypothetical protein